MKYPDKDLVIDTLAEVARRVGHSVNAQHPVDIAAAMSFAIEYGGETLAVLIEKDRL